MDNQKKEFMDGDRLVYGTPHPLYYYFNLGVESLKNLFKEIEYIEEEYDFPETVIRLSNKKNGGEKEKKLRYTLFSNNCNIIIELFKEGGYDINMNTEIINNTYNYKRQIKEIVAKYDNVITKYQDKILVVYILIKHYFDIGYITKLQMSKDYNRPNFFRTVNYLEESTNIKINRFSVKGGGKYWYVLRSDNTMDELVNTLEKLIKEEKK